LFGAADLLLLASQDVPADSFGGAFHGFGCDLQAS
jgi:hypothetical protein